MKKIGIILSLLIWTALVPAISFAQQSNEQLASYYYQNQEYEKAVELYETLYNRTANPYNYQMLYNCYFALNRLKEAESLVEKGLKQHPKELTLYVDLGHLKEQNGERKKAIKLYENVVQKTEFDTKQVNDLANAFLAANHPEYAIETYQYSRTKTLNQFLYVMELAGIYERMGNYEAMMNEYFDLMDHTPGMMPSVQMTLQRALNETSQPQLAEGLKKALSNRVRLQPNNHQYLEMMIWFSIQQNDYPFALTQAKAIDARIPEDGGEQVFRVAQIAQNNGDYATATAGYDYLIKKGPESAYFIDSEIGILRVKFLSHNDNYPFSDAQISELRTQCENLFSQLGKNRKTIPIMREYAKLMAYHTSELQTAVDILYDILELPRLESNTQSEVKIELGDLLLFAGEIWDASLLYSQVEKSNKNDILGSIAKLKNAKLSYYNNDFEWAKSQLDVLRASTSKLVANDAMELSLLISDNMEEDSTYTMLELYASADLLFYRNQLDKAWDAFDAITHQTLSHPLFDEILMQKAKIRIKQSRFLEADSLLQKLIEFYPTEITADDAIMMLAELNENQLANPSRSKEYYEKLIIDYPGSLYIDRARKRFNALKTAN